ncbi:MAG: GntR family transcriptional regulator [Provencibacterium sp.]|nr:GntR family transcriptional regulator [Provencibacterium sp.]
MEERQTLFQYVYGSLKEQIQTGRLEYGEALPSITRLCGYYQVGIRTIRDVLQALQAEGLIRSQPRKATYACYRPPDSLADNPALQEAVRNRRFILEAYETAALLMPPAFALCLSNGGARKKLEAFSIPPPGKKAGRKEQLAASVLLYSLLQGSGNRLLAGLYSALETYMFLPSEGEETVNLSLPLTSALRRLVQYPAASSGEAQARLEGGVRRQIPLADSILSRWAARYPIPSQAEAIPFRWIPSPEESLRYRQIAGELVNQIGSGEFPSGSLLPSEAALAARYGVSAATIRKALARLNESGFARTVNGVGTRAGFPDKAHRRACMKKSPYMQEAILYLSALQLMALFARPAAQLAWSRMDSAVIEAISRESEDSAAGFPLPILFRHLTACIPLQPFRCILEELGRRTSWGRYFARFDPQGIVQSPVYQKSKEAFRCLQAGNVSGFAGQWAACYAQCFQTAREEAIQCGLSEAKLLTLPR